MYSRCLPLTQRLLLLCISLSTAALISGCSGDDSSKPGDARHELAAHRQLWVASGLADYDLHLTRSCFCAPELLGPLNIRVTDGSVASVWRDPGHQFVDPQFGTTVAALFGQVESAIEGGAETINVTYNQTYGYPEEIAVSWAGVSDGNWSASAELLCRGAGEETSAACDCAGDARTLQYRFVAKDSAGALLAAGCLGLTFTDTPSLSQPEAVTGRRCLRGTCGVDAPGALPGEWDVGGQVNQSGSITLDLNSGVADFNIFLDGRFTGMPSEHGDFAGEWSYSTLLGLQESGTFTATRTP